MNKIEKHFDNERYVVFFGHEMPVAGYRYIEDYDDEVDREFFIALFKLFVNFIKHEHDTSYDTFKGVNYYFDEDFGCYDDDEFLGNFINELDENDIRLSKKEEKLIGDFLINLVDDVASFEESEYCEDYEDSDIEEAIEDKSFVIVLSTRSLW